MNKSRKFGKEILSHFREITLFVGGHFLSAPCIITYFTAPTFSVMTLQSRNYQKFISLTNSGRLVAHAAYKPR